MAETGIFVRVRKAMVWLLIFTGTAYGIAAGAMFAIQRDLVFKPGGALESPAERGLSDVVAETITLSDGTKVLAWQAKPRIEGAPTVLYFHGQGGNVSGRSSRFKQILDSGLGLLAASYRGYPGSGGAPSEQAFIADGIELYDRLADAGKTVIVHGESLGTGVAAAVAAARPAARMLVLEAPFTAALDLAARDYPWLPVSVLMRDPFVTRDRILAVTSPVLIVHGTDDRIIPVEHGKALYAMAPGPKRLKIVHGGRHGDLWLNGLWPAVLAFLDASQK